MTKGRVSAREMLEACEYFESSQWRPQADLLDEQWLKLKSLLAWSYEHIPFYASRFRKVDVIPQKISSLEDFYRLPLMKRQDLVDAELNGLRVHSFPATSSHTTGTSGPSVTVWRDQSYDAKLTFPLWRRWLKAAGLQSHDRYLRLVTVPVGAARTLGRALDISMMTSVSTLIEKIESAKPNGIIMTPATLEYLSLELMERDRKAPKSLKNIFTNGDNLTLSGRRLCRQGFGCDPIDHYAARECSSGIAWQCSEVQGYHVNVENVVVEILDTQGRPVAPGEVGRVVITDLSSKPVPLIRYEIGDLASWQEGPCNCGRSLPCLASIDGRIVERMKLKSGEWLTCHVLNMAFGQIPSPLQYQVREDQPFNVTIDVVLPPKIESSEVLQLLKIELQKTVLSTIEWKLNPVDRIPGEIFGKRRLFHPYESAENQEPE